MMQVRGNSLFGRTFARPAHRRNVSSCSTMDAKHPLTVVQRQLECYNARDLEQFMQLIAPNVVVTNDAGQVLASSAEQLRPRYVERFKSPVHCELLGRLALGNVVVDREIITGLPDNGVADCLATYTIEDGLIAKIQFVWRPRVAGTKL